jgi:hypothetical protein
MAYENTSKREIPTWAIVPPHPSHCNRGACTEKVTALFLQVRTPGNVLKAGHISEFARKTKDGWVLNTGYTFVKWVARCYRCYDEERVPC